MDSIAAYEPFYDGFIASRADLLAMRGVTVADREEEQDLENFKYFLRTTVESGQILPQLDRQSVEALKTASGVLSRTEALVLCGILRDDNFMLFESLRILFD